MLYAAHRWSLLPILGIYYVLISAHILLMDSEQIIITITVKIRKLNLKTTAIGQFSFCFHKATILLTGLSYNCNVS